MVDEFTSHKYFLLTMKFDFAFLSQNIFFVFVTTALCNFVTHTIKYDISQSPSAGQKLKNVAQFPRKH